MPEADAIQSEGRGRGLWLKRFGVAVLALIAFALFWYTVNRILAPARRIQIRSMTPTASAPAATPNRIIIASYNIAHSRGNTDKNWNGESVDVRKQRLDEIANVLISRHPDIVVFNEIDFEATWSGGFDQIGYMAERIGLPYHAGIVNLDISLPFFTLRIGSAVLSRWPIKTASEIEYPNFSDWENLFAGRKRGLLCEINHPSLQSIFVVPIHLEHRSPELQNESARRVLEAIPDNRPVILAGDFNAPLIWGESEDVDSELETAVMISLDSGRFQTEPDHPYPESEYTYPTTEPIERIDWILVPSEWKILSTETLFIELSDHRPIFMKISPSSD